MYNCYPDDNHLSTIVGAIGRLNHSHGLATTCELNQKNMETLSKAQNIHSLILVTDFITVDQLDRMADIEGLKNLYYQDSKYVTLSDLNGLEVSHPGVQISVY